MQAKLRPIYNRYVASFGKASLNLRISPDTWTFISLAQALLAAVALAQGKFWWGLVLSLAVLLSDVMDGATARVKGVSSSFGMVLDHVVDRYDEFAIIAGLLVGGWISPAAGMFGLSGMIMASYVRAKAESTGEIKRCDVGITGRVEKLFIIYGSILLLQFGLNQFAEYVFWLLGLLAHITTIQRLLYARRMMVRQGKRISGKG